MSIFLDTKFFGRKEELKKIIINALLGKNTLIIGKKGIGKSALLEQAISIITGATHRIDISPTALAEEFKDIRLSQRLKSAWKKEIKIIKADLTKPKANLFTDIIQTLYQNNDIENTDEVIDITPDGTITIKAKIAPQVIIKSIKNKNYIFFIDDLDLATQQTIEFIFDLLQSSTVIATTTELKNEKKLKALYSMFEKIELKELDTESSRKLTDYLIQTYIPELEPEKRELLRNEVLRTSRGNPTLIKSMLSHATAQKHLKEEDIKKLRALEEAEFINLGPFFAFLIGSITIIKILQIGLENRETYILLSIFSFLAYLTIRVFRYFFLFRPQRKK